MEQLELKKIFTTPSNSNCSPDKAYLTTTENTTTVVRFQDTEQFLVIKTEPGTHGSYYNPGSIKHKIVNDEGQEYENALEVKINKPLTDLAYGHFTTDDVEIISKPTSGKKLATALYALDEICHNSLGAKNAKKWPCTRRRN